jgi:acetoacetyl-CoA reductase/3-oxoacyl-[acyl-carrier protein] reductase
MSIHPSISELVTLRDKVALVVGGSGGIGSAVVELFLSAGGRVLSVDRPGREAPGGAEFIACDLTDPGDRERLQAHLARELERLDVLVHCAGITRDHVLWKMSDEEWDDVLRTNLDSAFHVLRMTVPLLRASGNGAVVLVSSINGQRGKLGQANYAASKAGLIGLGLTAARELGRFGVRVNVLAPGLVRTAMTETLGEDVVRAAADEAVLGRIGEPHDVATAVLFLASAMSRHVTGQVLRVDGGQLMG